jgi:putative nucleotidyltransferase with HDIG domain
MSLINNLLETQEFATLPPVAARVLKLLENDNVDMRDISRVIEADAPLTLKLLRVANSPLYATRTEVNSIQQAIITLGLNRLTNIVLGVSIFSRFLISSQKDAAEFMEKFWWHSSCTGIVAKSLSSKINHYFKEAEFIGGLLHDIGKLAMLQFDSAKYKQCQEIVTERLVLDEEAEMEVFGVTHIDVGYEIAKLWKLPEELSTIILNHDHPSQAENHKELVAVVRFADMLCEIWGAGVNEGLLAVDFENEESWQVLCSSYPELKELDVEVFTFELEEDFKKSADFLNLIVADS